LSEQEIKEEINIEDEVLRDLEIEIMKNHLKIVLLLAIKKNGPLSGYDILRRTQKKYGFNLSPGTIYTQLYALERKNFLKGQIDPTGKRVFSLTAAGLRATAIILSSRDQIEKMFAMLFE
jgi:DNA-binding PadR family transcriptional regulator